MTIVYNSREIKESLYFKLFVFEEKLLFGAFPLYVFHNQQAIRLNLINNKYSFKILIWIEMNIY